MAKQKGGRKPAFIQKTDFANLRKNRKKRGSVFGFTKNRFFFILSAAFLVCLSFSLPNSWGKQLEYDFKLPAIKKSLYAYEPSLVIISDRTVRILRDYEPSLPLSAMYGGEYSKTDSHDANTSGGSVIGFLSSNESEGMPFSSGEMSGREVGYTDGELYDDSLFYLKYKSESVIDDNNYNNELSFADSNLLVDAAETDSVQSVVVGAENGNTLRSVEGVAAGTNTGVGAGTRTGERGAATAGEGAGAGAGVGAGIGADAGAGVGAGTGAGVGAGAVKGAVVLDAGHGGADPGSFEKGECEKDITLKVILRTAELLREAGVEYVLTRTGDYTVNLAQRLEHARADSTAMFISIHCDWFEENAINGTSTLYDASNGDSKNLAELVQAKITDGLGTCDRSIHPHNNIVLLRDLDIPAIVIELGFFSNEHDFKLMQTESFREQAARNIAGAICDALQ